MRHQLPREDLVQRCLADILDAKLNVSIGSISAKSEYFHRLYEQKKTAREGAVLLVNYVTRWLRRT